MSKGNKINIKLILLPYWTKKEIICKEQCEGKTNVYIQRKRRRKKRRKKEANQAKGMDMSRSPIII